MKSRLIDQPASGRGAGQPLAVVFVVLLIASGAFSKIHAEQPSQAKVAQYFVVRQGALPILITAPHGGTQSLPDVDQRSDNAKNTLTRDTNTHRLALQLSEEIEALTGQTPFLVVSNASRKQVDLNRTDGTAAYEDPEARIYYRFYHDAIASHIKAIKSRWKTGLLIDIHGQGAESATIFRGTKNGLTVKALLTRHGEAALNGPNSLLGTMSVRGYRVHPDVRLPLARQSEDRRYNGGFTVQSYGSHQPAGIDAIQLEFGIDFRRSGALQQTAKDLATAIETVVQERLEEATAK